MGVFYMMMIKFFFPENFILIQQCNFIWPKLTINETKQNLDTFHPKCNSLSLFNVLQ